MILIQENRLSGSYNKNNIIGIFDEGCDNGGFTILPLSAAHITDAENSGSSKAISQFLAGCGLFSKL